MQAQKEFVHDVWPEVFSSRQNRSILKWTVTGVEEQKLRTAEGEKKIPCMTVEKERVKGIIPLPESGIKESDNNKINRNRLVKYLGQDVAFVVIAIDQEQDVFIASRKAALGRLAAQAWTNLKEDQIVEAVARRINDNGAVVEFNGIEAFLPIYELNHGWVEEITDVIQPGDQFNVKVVNLDPENEKVTVSLKALLPDPWPQATKKYKKNGIYQGIATGTTRYGVFVALEPGVNALCQHLKTDKYNVEKGDMVAVRVSTVDGNKRKITGNVIRLIRKNKTH